MADLNELLTNLLGGAGAQQAQQNANVAGGSTPNYAPDQQSVNMGNRIGNAVGSPLGRALLAGLFAKMGTPKLAGSWGGISNAGLTALGEYSRDSQQDVRNQQINQQAQEEAARTQIYNENLRLAQQKMAQAQQAPLWYDLDGGPPVRAQDPPGRKFVDQDTWQKIVANHLAAGDKSGPQSTYDKRMETLQANKDMAGQIPAADDKTFTYVHPKTLQPAPDTSLSGDELNAQGFKKVTRKDADAIKGYQDALDTLEQMRADSKNVFPKKSELDATGTLGAGIKARADKVFNPENYAKFDADVAGLAGVPRIVLGGNRMNLTEWQGVMSHIAGAKNYGTTQESVDAAIDQLERQLKTRLKQFSPSYGGTAGASGSFDEGAAGESGGVKDTTTPTTTPNFIPGTKAVRLQ